MPPFSTAAARHRPLISDQGDQEFVREASKVPRIPQSINALQLRQLGQGLLRTGVAGLDDLLRGGLPCGGISEISGEAGAGKTQILLQMLVRAQLPVFDGGLARKAALVCTEGDVPIARLQGIATAMAASRPDLFETPDDIMRNIFIEKASTPQEMLDAVQERLPQLMEQEDVGLIVLDSVAAPVRFEEGYNGKENATIRSDLLFRLASQLKSLSSRKDCVCLISNQVVDVCDDAVQRPTVKEPALGMAWGHCVNSRMFIARVPEAPEYNQERAGALGLREVSLLLSPWAAPSSCKLRITARGVEDP